MNGVCITMKGWLDTQRLDGAGYLEYDDDYSKVSRFVALSYQLIPIFDGLQEHLILITNFCQ